MDKHKLVEISSQVHKVDIALAYATADNFIGQRIYAPEMPCLLHPDAEVCLRRAIKNAQLAGYQLRILDAYRPLKAHAMLWHYLPDARYIADIKIGSNHSRGVAVDVALLCPDGSLLDMGTPFDTMEVTSHHHCPTLPPAIQQHRFLLLGIMLDAGFVPLQTEWWHYELPNAQQYPLIDAVFDLQPANVQAT